jgi:hypothetical protein
MWSSGGYEDGVDCFPMSQYLEKVWKLVQEQVLHMQCTAKFLGFVRVCIA